MRAEEAPTVDPHPAQGKSTPAFSAVRSSPAIRIESLRKSYADRAVLDGLSFEVSCGEIFGILGANGAGKTTAVEIAQGLRDRDGGFVEILGFDPSRDRGSLRGQLGAQLQSSALPERLRVGEALQLFTRLAGDVVDWKGLGARWDLTRLESVPFGTLSGGDRQRLLIALALASGPRLIFLDELTQGLDPSARRATWRSIERVRDQGATVVLVTHYMDEAERLCDRIGILQGGRFAACGTPGELVSSLGGSVSIQFTSVLADQLAGLERVLGVRSVSHDGRTVRIEVEDGSVVSITAELDRRGFAPRDYAVTRPTLEDAYVSLTEGSLS